MATKISAFGFMLCFVLASTSPTTKIVGGAETNILEYPFIVQVDYYGIFSGLWSQSCAANILTSRYVLSAAHCFTGVLYSPEFRRIRAGATYRNTGGFVYYVQEEYNHPSYGLNRADGDITVVKLAEHMEFNPVVQPGTIVPQDTVVPDNVPVVHAGWGTTSSGGSVSPILLDTTIYTVNNDLCRERYLNLDGVVTTNMICAGLLDVGGKDACQGDSGGPLYYGSNKVLVGIVSWGHGCANDTYPGVSTAVGPYTDWIVSVAV